MTSTNPTGPSTGETPTAAPLPETPVPTLPRSRQTPSRWGGCLPWLVVLAVLLTGFAIWKFPSFKAQAELGSAYAARVGCSCRYVQGRSLESCQSDFEPGMEMVSLSEDPATKTVTGSVPLLASRSARYAGASGCLLRPED
ncbi:MAG: hypothetical protein Q8Q79_14075 [Sphingopyxis sp.]|uniref:hypothetical protein n=1 Tax=Sphingopyxis bauzanensis TaxID=651663 RepID=UPI0016648AD9|nr:hypothetical protein [Sphingopyxis bauzanensis]MDP3784030.1 hypothetical protein [Sphingopyxis sp.]GGJ48892.1 hypothetical protein GCM10011393_18920 [Sphingopyxis bauzanensis]